MLRTKDISATIKYGVKKEKMRLKNSNVILLKLFSIFIVIAIFLAAYISREHSENSDLSSIESLNYEFLGRVENISQVESKNPNQTIPEIEVLNLNTGAGLSIEKMRLCDLNDSPTSVLHAEQVLKILWEAKNNGTLVKIGYSSMWEKCIKSVKLSIPPSDAQ